jgi:NTP pyrophosphatase (non-canonical NTP hydrolase)
LDSKFEDEDIYDSKFKDIYKKQEEFENLLIAKSGNWPGKTLADFDKKEKTKFSKELSFLLFLEIAEFMGAVGNYKTHKIQEDGKDEKDIKEEIVDMFIFVLDTALTHSMTAEELLEEVAKKQKINFDRQATGY